MSDAQFGVDVSNFILPPDLVGRVWKYIRSIQIAPPSEKLDAWVRTFQGDGVIFPDSRQALASTAGFTSLARLFAGGSIASSRPTEQRL